MIAPVTTMVTWNIWKEVTDTQGRPQRWKEDRKKQTSWLQPLQISSIHKRGLRENTVCNMFSFAHLCRWMVRFSVRRAQTLGVSTFSLPTQNTLIHTWKLQLPFLIYPPAILFYFSGAFLKMHLSNRKRLLSSVETDGAKKQWGNSHADRRDHRDLSRF